MSNGSLSMTTRDLAQVYQRDEPLFAGHQRAVAVNVGPEGITVVANANSSGGSDHTWVMRLNLDGVVVWERRYDPKYGYAGAITRLAQNDFVIAGAVQRSPMTFQGSLLHIDEAGEIVNAEVVGPVGDAVFNSVQAQANGTIVSAGSSGHRGWLVTTDSKLRNSNDRAVALSGVKVLRLLSSGDVVVLGRPAASTDTIANARSKLVSIAPDGRVRWERTLPTSGRSIPTSLIVRPNGVIAVGNSVEGIWLAYCDTTGALIWERSIADAGPWSAVGLADGFAVAGARTSTDSERSQHIWRFAEDGTLRSDQQWNRRDLGTGLDQIREDIADLDATGDGGLVLVGSTTRGPGKTNVWVVRLAPDGKVMWERTFGKPAPAPT